MAAGPSVGAATLSGHRICLAAHPEGLPQGFTPHTPTEIWFPHKVQPPPEQLSCSCCHPEISTKNYFQQHLPGVWSHSRVVLHHLPCFKPHSAGKLQCCDQSSQDGVVENFIPPLRKAQARLNVSQRHSAKASPGLPPSPPDE